jgi:hypothetical protein
VGPRTRGPTGLGVLTDRPADRFVFEGLRRDRGSPWALGRPEHYERLFAPKLTPEAVVKPRREPLSFRHKVGTVLYTNSSTEPRPKRRLRSGARRTSLNNKHLRHHPITEPPLSFVCLPDRLYMFIVRSKYRTESALQLERLTQASLGSLVRGIATSSISG